MLEVLLFMSIYYACMYMPLRGKAFCQLSENQQSRVEKGYNKYMRTRKGRTNPNMSIEDEYLPMLQKSGMTYLIMAIVIFPIYCLVMVYLFSTMT